MEGVVKSNGKPRKSDGSGKFKKDSCYILQDDQLVPLFTVHEIMSMATNLKINSELSEKAKEIIVSLYFGCG